jgi:MraZ protein
MFVGQFQHSLDDKWRVILPARIRSQLEGGGYMAKGRDRCVCVYTPEEWERVANRMGELATRGTGERQAARTFFAGAAEMVPDRQGRVQIPPHLREFARLEREVVVAGVGNRVEIWDAELWRQHDQEGEQVIAAADSIPDFGI